MNVIVSTTFLENPKMEFFGTLILVDARFGGRPPSSDEAWKQPEVITLQTGKALRWEPELDENGNNQPSDPYEPIEGITTRDVGWMLVPVGYLFWLYNQLSEIDGTQRLALDQWMLQYRRPPDEYGPMAHDFDTEREEFMGMTPYDTLPAGLLVNSWRTYRSRYGDS
jgi:hypothetical protein